jgi:prepilin-type N-terminal cleavage/methylation domain-containing protein
MRRNAGFTLLEVLMVAVLAAVIVGATWELFTNTYKRVVKTTSAANALQSALVLLERFGRDVSEMGMPPCLDRFPTKISTDAAAIAFYVPERPADTKRPTAVFRPVTWSLKPAPDKGFRVMRDGKSVGGITVTTWTFLYIEEGGVRKDERNVPLDGFWRGSLTESVPTSFVSTRDPRADPRTLAREMVEGMDSEDREEETTATLAGALSAEGPLGHAGPFVYFRFTVVDEGGAKATRAVLFDLVNVHMVADHGYGFAYPKEAIELKAPLRMPACLNEEDDHEEPFD